MLNNIFYHAFNFFFFFLWNQNHERNDGLKPIQKEGKAEKIKVKQEL